jgi:hypothetical protein
VLSVASRTYAFPDVCFDPFHPPRNRADPPSHRICPKKLYLILSKFSPPQFRPFRLTHPPANSAPVLPYPLVLRPSGKLVYKEPKAGFDIVRLIKGNPMILMMGAGVLMVFLLPKIMVRIIVLGPPRSMLFQIFLHTFRLFFQ